MSTIVTPDEARDVRLGDSLTRLLDRRLALYHELVAIEGDIYQELVNRLQGQIGAVLGPLDTRIAALEQTPP
jgi:hypothetical protein